MEVKETITKKEGFFPDPLINPTPIETPTHQ